MNLHIFDIANYVSAGAASQTENIIQDSLVFKDGMFQAVEFPCGGVSFVLNTVHEFMSEDNLLIYVGDRTPIFKRAKYKKLFPSEEYKGNRPVKKSNVYEQRLMAEDILKCIGLNVFACEGYEADDIIYSLVQQYSESFTRVFIHSRDSDMRLLVRDNVAIAPVGRHGHEINVFNFEHVPMYDYLVPHNATMLYKLAYGDGNKDNIHAMGKAYYDLVDRFPTNIGSKFCNREYVDFYCSYLHPDDQRLVDMIDLRWPLTVDSDFIVIDESLSIDLAKLKWFGKEVRNKYYRYEDSFQFPECRAVIDNYLNN